MRLALQATICCCVFAMVVVLIKGATVEVSNNLKKRFKVWLQTRMRRDTAVLASASERRPQVCCGLTRKEGADDPAVQSRSRRSPGCSLATCVVHDMFYKIHRTSDDARKSSAPQEKMDKYGRRRRRSLAELHSRLAVQLTEERRRPRRERRCLRLRHGGGSEALMREPRPLGNIGRGPHLLDCAEDKPRRW